MEVEVYLLELQVCLYPHHKQTEKLFSSRKDNIGNYFNVNNTSTPLLHIGAVLQKVREQFSVSTTDECRLWKEFDNNHFVLLKDLDQNLFDLRINAGQVYNLLVYTIKDNYFLFIVDVDVRD